MHRQRMKRLVAFVLGLCLIFGLTPNMQVKVAAAEKTLKLKVFGVNSGEERTFTTEKQPYSEQAIIEVTGDDDNTNITIGFDKLRASFEKVYNGTTLDMGKAVIKWENEEYTFDPNSKNVSIPSAKADKARLVIPAEQGTTVKFVLGGTAKEYPGVVDAAGLENKLGTFLATAEAQAELKKNEVTNWTYEAKEGTSLDLLGKDGKLGSGKQMPQVTYLVVKAGLAPVQQKVTVTVSYLKPGSSTDYIDPKNQDVEIEVKEYSNIKELGNALKTPKIDPPVGCDISTIYQIAGGANKEVQFKYTPHQGDKLTVAWVVKDKSEKTEYIYFDAFTSVFTETSEDPYTKEKKEYDRKVVSREVTIKPFKSDKDPGSVKISPNIPTPNNYFDEKFNTMMEFDFWTKDDKKLAAWNQSKGTASAPQSVQLADPRQVDVNATYYAKFKPMAKVEVNFYYIGDPGITIYTGKDYVLRRPIVVYFSQGTPITLDKLGEALDGKLGKENTIDSIKYLDPESGVEKVFNLLPELATLDGNPMNILNEDGSTYDSNKIYYDGGRMHTVKLYYSYNQNSVTVTFDTQVPNDQERAKVGIPKPKVTEKGMYINAPTDWQPTRRRGYTFQGWYPTQEDAVALTNEISFPYMVQENITLYAGWEGNKVYIIYRYNNGMGTEYKLARNGELIPEPSFPVPYWPGMKFSGWYMTLGPEKGIGIDNPGPKEKDEKQEEGKGNAQKQWPLKGFRLPIDDPYLGQGNTTPGFITSTVVNGPMLVDAMWTPLVTTSSLTKPDQAGAPQVAANQVGTNPAKAADLPEAGEHNYSFVVGGFLAIAVGIFLLKRKAF